MWAMCGGVPVFKAAGLEENEGLKRVWIFTTTGVNVTVLQKGTGLCGVEGQSNLHSPRLN